MGLFTFFKKKPDEKKQARRIYANAVRLSGSAKAIRANKIVVALRAAQVMDKIFEEGQKKVLAYDEALMIALAGGEDPPGYSQAEPNDCFQEILTASGKVTAYVPFKYAQIMSCSAPTTSLAACPSMRSSKLRKASATRLPKS